MYQQFVHQDAEKPAAELHGPWILFVFRQFGASEFGEAAKL